MNQETWKRESMVLHPQPGNFLIVGLPQVLSGSPWGRTAVCGRVRTTNACTPRPQRSAPYPLPRGPAPGPAVAPRLTGFPASGTEDLWP